MESPNSQPGDFSSHVLSFALSSLDPVGMDRVSTGQPPDPSYVPVENHSPDPAPVTPASYAGLNGFQESSQAYDQCVDHFNYTSKKSPTMGSPSQISDMAASWPEQPAQLTMPQESAPHYCSAHQGLLDGVPYPSPEDTSSSIGSLSTFNFTPPSVSQPTSFLRQSADIDHGPEREALPDRLPKRARLHPPLSTDPFGIYGRGCSQLEGSGGYTGTLPLDSELSLSGTQATITTPASASTPGDRFTKVFDEQAVPNNSPGASCSSAGDISHASECPDGESSKQRWKAYLNNVEDNYGLDCGRPDLDLNRNDDHSAIDINSALVSMGSNRRASHVSALMDSTALEQPNWDGTKHGYYGSPVPINIPRYLSPLPSSLLENPINLMYFHHYLNHTSRMLVPHDCEDNPFVTVMPSSKPPCTGRCFILTKQWRFRTRIS